MNSIIECEAKRTFTSPHSETFPDRMRQKEPSYWCDKDILPRILNQYWFQKQCLTTYAWLDKDQFIFHPALHDLICSHSRWKRGRRCRRTRIVSIYQSEPCSQDDTKASFPKFFPCLLPDPKFQGTRLEWGFFITEPIKRYWGETPVTECIVLL